MSFTGQFPGSCDTCGEQTKGTEVEYNTANRIVHVICPDALPEKTVKVCPGCNLALPATGVCDYCD